MELSLINQNCGEHGRDIDDVNCERNGHGHGGRPVHGCSEPRTGGPSTSTQCSSTKME